MWIENNEIERVARCGMFLSGSWVRRPGWDNGMGSYYYDEETGEEKGYYPLKGIVVRGNTLDYTGGDGTPRNRRLYQKRELRSKRSDRRSARAVAEENARRFKGFRRVRT